MKYSVIIPVYNAEKTLRRCIDSLLAEHYSDAEIILVNDGSRDNSESICREYAETHDNIRLISQENGGVSSARNAGLDAASGVFVVFVDSDDYVASDFFASMDRMVGDDCADLIRFSGYYENRDEKREFVLNPLIARTREESLPRIIDSICNKSINVPWAKLYKREIIEEHMIRFPIGVSVGEDLAFNIVYSFYAKSYAKSDLVVYAVNIENSESLSRKRRSDVHQQFRLVGAFLDSKLKEAPIPEHEKEAYRRAIDYVNCVGIYYVAKLMILNKEGWFKRQGSIFGLCQKVNSLRMKYPKTRYCVLTTLPIRLYLTPAIDAMARVLSRRR